MAEIASLLAFVAGSFGAFRFLSLFAPMTVGSFSNARSDGLMPSSNWFLTVRSYQWRWRRLYDDDEDDEGGGTDCITDGADRRGIGTANDNADGVDDGEDDGVDGMTNDESEETGVRSFDE